MKKYVYIYLVELIVIVGIFSFYFFTDPLDLLKHFSFLSPDGIFSFPMTALFKLFLFITAIAIAVTSILISDVRNQIIKFCKDNLVLTIGAGLYLAIYFSTLIFSKDKLYRFFFLEDGLFEYISAALYLAAAILFLYIFFSLTRKTKHFFTLILFLGLFGVSFLIGMEEISWGQRIIGWETPEHLEKINYQNETNLHNLIVQEGVLNNLIYGVTGLLFLLFFSSSYLPEKFTLNINRSLLPRKKLVYGAVFLPLLSLGDKEPFEEILSLLLFLYAFETFKKIKSKAVVFQKKKVEPKSANQSQAFNF